MRKMRKMEFIIRGEILHILLTDNDIERIIVDKIEDRNEHEVEVHLDKDNHIVSMIITNIKFDVANIKNLIEKVKESLSRIDTTFPSEELLPIIREIEKDHNIRFRVNSI